MIHIGWNVIHSKIKTLPKGKVYGIPRGGEIIAQLTGNAVDNIKEADYILDDLIDSGRTKNECMKRFPEKPFHALIDKNNEGINDWIVFPWEKSDIKDSVTNILTHIGENPRRDGLIDTPNRVIKSWEQLYGGYKTNIQNIFKTFENEELYDQMVVLQDIEFYSTCEHHLLPFFGKAKVGYIPKDRIIGISKLARLVECYSRRLQVQERLTNQIAKSLQENLNPLGVGVILEAKHMCMCIRGVNKQNSIMKTSCLLGCMKDEVQTREEFLSL